MNYLHFNELDLQNQVDLICKKGVFLLKRTSDFFELSLFGVEGFYVEVAYHKTSGSSQYKAFDNPGLIAAPYLEKINLEGLF